MYCNVPSLNHEYNFQSLLHSLLFSTFVPQNPAINYCRHLLPKKVFDYMATKVPRNYLPFELLVSFKPGDTEDVNVLAQSTVENLAG